MRRLHTILMFCAIAVGAVALGGAEGCEDGIKDTDPFADTDTDADADADVDADTDTDTTYSGYAGCNDPREGFGSPPKNTCFKTCDAFTKGVTTNPYADSAVWGGLAGSCNHGYCTNTCNVRIALHPSFKVQESKGDYTVDDTLCNFDKNGCVDVTNPYVGGVGGCGTAGPCDSTDPKATPGGVFFESKIVAGDCEACTF